jgi:hypothetical protein
LAHHRCETIHDMKRGIALLLVLMCSCAVSSVTPLRAPGVPAQLTARGTWSGAARVARVRVWADDDHRAQNAQWQRSFDEQLAYANRVLGALGIRLEAEYREWAHRAQGGTLIDDLDALAQIDAADDAAWVIGLTGSVNRATVAFGQMGLAEVGGWHVVLRGHADAEERKQLEQPAGEGSGAASESLLAVRRLHKSTALLLHQLAHSLGAVHETSADGVMNAKYSPDAAAISERNCAVMRIALDDRLKPATERDPRATIVALLDALGPEWNGWDAGDRKQVVGRLQAQLAVATGSLSARALRQYRQVEQLLTDGTVDAAAMTLAPLLRMFPENADLGALSCRVELARRGAQDAGTIAACERAVASSADVAPAIAFAAARAKTGDAAGARRTLVGAEERLAGVAPDKAAEAWRKLAAQYRAMGAVTWAEDALARAGGAESSERESDGIAGWAATTRARYGIPRDGARWKLSPDDEPAAATAIREAVALVNASEFDAAAKAIESAERRWPELPGVLTARCALDYRRDAIAAARAHCDRAIAQGGSSWALYLRGQIELATGRPGAVKSAIARLRAAIALDPDLAQAWQALGQALGRTKANAELDQLRRDYRVRFRARLPD